VCKVYKAKPLYTYRADNPRPEVKKERVPWTRWKAGTRRGCRS
jgi:hypothetical protein